MAYSVVLTALRRMARWLTANCFLRDADCYLVAAFAYLCQPFSKGYQPQRMNSYELVIIFDPVLSDDELRDEIKTYQDIITSGGGSMVHEERWGLRPLAFPIRRKTTGLYYLAEFQCPGEVIARLETQFGRDDRVIRQVITRMDKYAIEYAERRRRRLQAAKEAPEAEKVEAIADAVSTGDEPETLKQTAEGNS